MKGTVTLKLLEAIGGAAVRATDLFMVLMDAGYGTSFGALEHRLAEREWERARRRNKREEQVRLKQRYANMLYKLKRDGLIAEKEPSKSGGRMLVLLKKGKERLAALKKRHTQALPDIVYRKDTAGARFIVVVFDVPERERRKRAWLRAALRALGLSMVQWSVWVGKSNIPKEFLEDLAELGLVERVEIFEVSKGGSLRQVT